MEIVDEPLKLTTIKNGVETSHDTIQEISGYTLTQIRQCYMSGRRPLYVEWDEGETTRKGIINLTQKDGTQNLSGHNIQIAEVEEGNNKINTGTLRLTSDTKTSLMTFEADERRITNHSPDTHRNR